MLCSIKLLAARNKHIALRRHEVNTFSAIDSNLKDCNASPFLKIKIVQAFSHPVGTVHVSQAVRMSSVKHVLRYGQRLKHMIEVWSNGQGEPDAFVL